MTLDELIRKVDDVERPAPGRWSIAAHQPVSLRTADLRRRTIAGTCRAPSPSRTTRATRPCTCSSARGGRRAPTPSLSTRH